MFTHLVEYLVAVFLYTPFKVVALIGEHFFPSCTDMGYVVFTESMLNSMVNWLRFLWPFLKYFPWEFMWNYLSIILLLYFIFWLWDNFDKMSSFFLKYWWIVAVWFVVGGIVTYFIGDLWRASPVFTEVFGTSATDTAVGTGFGGSGGGGGSW